MGFKKKNDETTSKVTGEGSTWRTSRTVKYVALGLVGLIIYGLGVNVGNGRISFGAHTQTGLPSQLNYATVNQVYNSLKDNYNGKLTASQLTDGLKHGLAEATNDPYTEYFTAAEAKSFNSELNNSFSGIGAELGQDSDKNLIIISPISGFPADKAGLKAQDIITSINGQTTIGLSVDAAVGKIRGSKGTTVTLGILRDKSQTLSFKVTRDDIMLPSVTTKTLDGNIGYMQISTFADDTSELAKKAATKLKADGVKGVILDLRGNPGGLLDAAVNVSSLWLSPGKTIVEQKGTGGDQVSTAAGNNILNGLPTVVLIDSGSASASEITTGALHDNHAAYVIGQKSYGKGVVQQLINFKDGSQLKVTVAGWYRPNGQNINHKGITPDQAVILGDTDAKAGNDTQLAAAEAYLARQ